MFRKRGFEPVKDAMTNYYIPKQSTIDAAASDFFSPISLVINPGEKASVYTNIKAYMKKNEVLLLNVRSSQGIKSDIQLANIQGLVDRDYFSNQDNDGNIIFCLKNCGTKPYIINHGDKIGQGMFTKFLRPDNGRSNNKRIGGVGSTGK